MIPVATETKQVNDITCQIIWSVVKWIEADLSRKLNVTVVAEKAGYTSWHFQRLFKRVTGYSVGHYIRARRMTVAAGLLKNTSFPITRIYLLVGIDNGATFCRMFQRHFGLTPTAYRTSYDDFSSRMLLPPVSGVGLLQI